MSQSKTFRFKHFLKERQQLSQSGKEQLLSVSEYYGVAPRSSVFSENRQESRADSLEGYRIVKKGDLVMNYMLAWKGAYGISEFNGIVSPAYSVFEVNESIVDLRFLHHRSRSKDMQSTFKSVSRGIMESRLRLYPEILLSLPIALPNLEDQRRISAGLDKQTTRIDTLIAKKTRFIELLKEKRQAIITKAMTKGLNDSVGMKDSGVEWIGRVPDEWVIGRLRDFCDSISTGPFGTALSASDYIEDGIPVINPSHMSNGMFKPDRSVSVSVRTARRLHFWALREGDIVTARRGELGRAAIVSFKEAGWVCGTGSLRLTPLHNKVSANYLYSLLQSNYAKAWLDRESVGSTMPNLSELLIGQLPVVMPPSLAEQKALLAKLDTLLLRVSQLIERTQQSIDLLKEKRSALITAAVTCKIVVREAA